MEPPSPTPELPREVEPQLACKICGGDAPLFGIQASSQGRLIVFAGGIPLEAGGKVVGAVGVSGGSVEQDHEVAEAGVAAF